jgi:hypothetical protein
VEGDVGELVGDDEEEAEGNELEVRANENFDSQLGLAKPAWAMAKNPCGSGYDPPRLLRPSGWVLSNPRGSQQRPVWVTAIHG